MSDETAAGPKTDINERRERIAASLEDQFKVCRSETDKRFALYKTPEGALHHNALESVIKLVRVSAQLANVIARLDGVKNRGSIPQ
jgi:hypothetical protein